MASTRPITGPTGGAHPMILVLDQDGVVSHRFSKEGYWDRPTIDIVLEALQK